MAATQQVDMDVVHGLTTMLPGINDGAIALHQSF